MFSAKNKIFVIKSKKFILKFAFNFALSTSPFEGIKHTKAAISDGLIETIFQWFRTAYSPVRSSIRQQLLLIWKPWE